MMEDFYMILPSNVENHGYYPRNTIPNFVTKLPQRMQIHGDWAVGVVEISYTYSWPNVPNDITFTMKYFDERSKGIVESKVVLPKGQYSSIEMLAGALNTVFKEFTGPSQAKLPFTQVYGTTLAIVNGIDSKGRMMFVEFDNEFGELVGINNVENLKKAEKYYAVLVANPNAKIPKEQKEQHGDVHPDLSRGIHSLFLYCDVIKPTFVGNSYSQILRVVEIPPYAKSGQQINIKYPLPFYIPVSANEFETIEIHLKDDAGEDIQFAFGRVIVTLHFRKTRN